jgi:hypothetical protein
MNWNILSESMLLASKRNEPVEPYVAALKQADFEVLNNVMSTDDEKKAFWLNIYNSFIQIVAAENANELKSNRHLFFSKKHIQIGNRLLSFDDIEHVILRRNSFKFGFGYLRMPLFAGNLRKFMLKKHDFRIHFALNCGAESCPPIKAYKPATISEQLHSATKSFLEQDCAFGEKENIIIVSRLLLWFHGDFGGQKGILKILKHYGILPEDKNPRIAFKPYNWNLKLKNFI